MLWKRVKQQNHLINFSDCIWYFYFKNLLYFGGDNVNYGLLSKQEFQEMKEHGFWRKPHGNDKLI